MLAGRVPLPHSIIFLFKLFRAFVSSLDQLIASPLIFSAMALAASLLSAKALTWSTLLGLLLSVAAAFTNVSASFVNSGPDAKLLRR